MKKSTLLLKVALYLIGILVLVLTVLLWVGAGGTVIQAAIAGLTLGYIFSGILHGLSLTLIPFYGALIQTRKLITYIDQGKAFSQLSVTALRKIKHCAVAISIIYLGLLPLIFIVAEWDDAPGLILVGVVPVFAAFVVALFSAVLEYLLEEAIIFKHENDLTV